MEGVDQTQALPKKLTKSQKKNRRRREARVRSGASSSSDVTPITSPMTSPSATTTPPHFVISEQIRSPLRDLPRESEVSSSERPIVELDHGNLKKLEEKKSAWARPLNATLSRSSSDLTPGKVLDQRPERNAMSRSVSHLTPPQLRLASTNRPGSANQDHRIHPSLVRHDAAVFEPALSNKLQQAMPSHAPPAPTTITLANGGCLSTDSQGRIVYQDPQKELRVVSQTEASTVPSGYSLPHGTIHVFFLSKQDQPHLYTSDDQGHSWRQVYPVLPSFALPPSQAHHHTQTDVDVRDDCLDDLSVVRSQSLSSARLRSATVDSGMTKLRPILSEESVSPRRGIIKSEAMNNLQTFNNVIRFVEDSPEHQLKRKRIVMEIQQTELHYVEALNSLFNLFIQPLSHSDWITPAKVAAIFLNAHELMQFHQDFLEKLSHRVTDWSGSQIIGDLFLSETDFLTKYVTFINGFETAMDTLTKEMQANPRFQTFIKQTEKSPLLNYQEMTGLLIQPVQRIPRYQLLLKDLIRNTEANHPDWSNLTKAISKIEGIAKYINEEKRSAENLTEITRLSNLLLFAKDQGLYPNPVFLKEGSVMLHREGHRDPERVYLFLFLDQAILTTERKKKGLLQYEVKLDIDMDPRTCNSIIPFPPAKLPIIHILVKK
eukprot:TRINITY_DN5761_c0_g1_i2.p1 TRINITY_DN5761_c0_g1~~TRINITY_DN5761_c0_g1_i2.p1  ORF type:complete len:682 (-),score=131.69 TRINITY_DN5761_c0_g1_i2:58-2034(-)